MTGLKKLLLPLCLVSLLSACAAPSNVIDVNPAITLPQTQPNHGQALTVTAVDARADKSLAKLNRNGTLVTLQPSRDPAFLMQEVLTKQMQARGFNVTSASGLNMQLTLNTLFADVQEGSLRYNIDAVADVTITLRGGHGETFSKNYRTKHSVPGAFATSNQGIADVLEETLSQVINNMASDPSLSDAAQRMTR